MSYVLNCYSSFNWLPHCGI